MKKIPILYEQIVEIFIEFPIEVLSTYNGISNLDITIDDQIVPCIHSALKNNGIDMKKNGSELMFNNGIFQYRMLLIAQAPNLDLNCIVEALNKEHFENSLSIKTLTINGNFEKLYPVL
jgi:hypothetical protein